MKPAVLLTLTILLFGGGLSRSLAEVPRNRDIADFDVLGRGVGWMRTDSSLLRTTDDGESWHNITPPQVQNGFLAGAFFSDSLSGWAVSGMAEASSVRVFRTRDAGESWEPCDLSLSAADAEDYVGRATISSPAPSNAWVMLHLASSSNSRRGILFSTSDSGVTWSRLPLPPIVGNMTFLSSKIGWIAGGPRQDQLFVTRDGGSSWQEVTIPTRHDRRLKIEAAEFQDELRGTVVGFTEEEPDLAIYDTVDGGLNWNLRIIVAFERTPPKVTAVRGDRASLVFSVPLSPALGVRGVDTRLPLPNRSVITRLRFATASAGWILAQQGVCLEPKRRCAQDIRLYSAAESGASLVEIARAWREVAEPELSVFPALTPPRTTPEAISGDTRIAVGNGFDRCETPSPSQMSVWWFESPYKSVGFYLGGAHASCAPPTVYLRDSGWVAKVTAGGWDVIPIWVGIQAQGWDKGVGKIGLNGADPYQQGLDEAVKAHAAAAEYGVLNTVVYYDIESYTATSAGRAAVTQFIRGWTDGAHAHGFKAGVYMGRRNAADDLAPLCSDPSSPDAIWIVSIASPKPSPYDPNLSVFGLSGLDDPCWNNNQRLRQYFIDSTEEYGGLALNIDNDLLRGPVVMLPSSKFSYGDEVEAVSTAPIRNSEGGTQIGNLSVGMRGQVVDGPRLAAVSGASQDVVYRWFYVDWNSGSDGWSAEQNLKLSSPAAGQITVTATLDGAPWSGPVRYRLTEPFGVNFSASRVPARFDAMKASGYTLTDVSGGPAYAELVSVTPSVTQSVAVGGSTTWTLQFSNTACVAAFGTTPLDCKGTSKPTVVTSSATELAATSAILNGTANPQGSTTTAWFEYGLASYAMSTSTVAVGSGTTSVSYSRPISSLQCGTAYVFRAVANNTNGTSYGGQGAFATAGCATATTGQASLVTASSADLNGSVNPNGSPAYGWFEWSTSPSFTTTYNSSPVSVGSGSTPVSLNATAIGLQSNTTYYWRTVASNGLDVRKGDINSFTTTSSGTSGNLLLNPGFEEGASYWNMSGDFYANCCFTYPHSGSRYAYLSTSTGAPGNNLYGTMYQNVTIPSNVTSATLRLWYNVSTAEPGGAIYDTVIIYARRSNQTLEYLTNFSNLDASTIGVYSERAVDLTPYRGQTIDVYLIGTTDSTYATTFRFDDFSLTTTSPPPPSVLTLGATADSSTTATVNGNANPNGWETIAWFDVSQSSAFATYFTSTTTQMGSGNSGLNYSANLTNLQPQTTYYYRAAASNSGGVQRGTASSFQTPATPDTTPDPFAFATQFPVALSVVVTSNAVTITGIDAPTPVTIVGGSYSISSGQFTSQQGTITNGQTIVVQVQSSAQYDTTTSAIVSVGGVSASFDVTTIGVVTNVVAKATSATSVMVSWSGAPGVSAYDVERSSDGTSFNVVGSTQGDSLADNSVVTGSAYLYRVRGKYSNSLETPYSSTDLATVFAFTDDPLPTNMVVKFAHFAELAAAISAVRTLAGLSPLTLAYARGSLIEASHILQLRNSLAEARLKFGLPPFIYTDPQLVAGVLVRREHIDEIREGVK